MTSIQKEERDSTEFHFWDPLMALSVLRQLIQHFGQFNLSFLNFLPQKEKNSLLWIACAEKSSCNMAILVRL
jgi:hypothetical protein